MDRSIIEVRDIAKRYRLGQTHTGLASHTFYKYKTMRDLIAGLFRPRLSRGNKKNETGQDNCIWALKDINFNVKPQEMVGIVGKNGAGKTTLLKILSQITDPSLGEVRLKGRVASLLEVGTGFHPELTGRENIFLNGSILGMGRREIKKKFDQIVEFAGVRKFIDTPVKRYSTGMYVRLAFAVAAHLDVEILLVDEVLAVGDFEFQKKCLSKMESVAQEGKTILFVSHNMSAIKKFCKRTILLEKGHIVADGPTNEVVNRYLSSGIQKHGEITWGGDLRAPGNNVVRLQAVRVKNALGKISYDHNIQEALTLEVEFEVKEDEHNLQESFYLYSEGGQLVFYTANNHNPQWKESRRGKGVYRSTCTIPADFLNEGVFIIDVGISTHPSICHALAKNIISFHIYDPGSGGVRGNFVREWPGGLVRPSLKWETAYSSSQKVIGERL